MHMNCNEAQNDYCLCKKELSEKELEAFLHHIAHCSDCMDELDTYYTVYQALIFWILAITMTTISGVCSQMISARHGGDSGAGGCSERLGGFYLS